MSGWLGNNEGKGGIKPEGGIKRIAITKMI
jgi:hypothetical protein